MKQQAEAAGVEILKADVKKSRSYRKDKENSYRQGSCRSGKGNSGKWNFPEKTWN